jgi:thiosulfate/3-mercaptopyruvate sulfurtransferase
MSCWPYADSSYRRHEEAPIFFGVDSMRKGRVWASEKLEHFSSTTGDVTMRVRQAFVAALLCSLITTSLAAENKYARPELLLEPGELAKPEAAKRFVLLDARKEEAYDQEHIPSARWVDHGTWKSALGDGTDADGWSKRIGDLGIGADSRVVVYDDASNKDAARIWWILRYWGVRDVRLLNGGWKTWQAEGFPTEVKGPLPAKAVEFVAAPQKRRLVTKDQILVSLADHRLQIVDARSDDEFCGIDLKDSKRGGAIPGAKHLEWSDLIDPATDRFKTPEELRRLFDKAGIDLHKPTASHCNSGGRASVMAFGLELMGAKDARNYYPGWSEWGNSDDVPIVVHQKE